MVLPRLVALSALFTVASCASPQTGALDTFARSRSCPEDRVTIRERTDLRWSSIVLANVPAPSPVDEVRDDPERFAKWKKDTDEEWALRAQILDRSEVFQATGCGHDVLLGCRHPISRKGGMIINMIVCDEAPPAQGDATKLGQGAR